MKNPLTESHHESFFVDMLRAGVLFSALIAVPGTSICWNLIPKMEKTEAAVEPPGQSSLPSDLENHSFQEMNDKYKANSHNDTKITESVDFPLSILAESSDSEKTASQLPQSDGMNPFSPPQQSKQSSDVQQMRWIEEAEHSDSLVSAAFRKEIDVVPLPPLLLSKTELDQHSAPLQNSFTQQKFASQQDSVPPQNISPIQFSIESENNGASQFPIENGKNAESQLRNFQLLEQELKQFGAKYYRLEKWGSRGELFRFSCYVSGTDSHRFQKHFQAIDSDELQVMERVLLDIRTWRQTQLQIAQ
ncbi:MAG: hypothetical protein ACRCUY_02460 [Thermoguttaceae bacterium]